MYTDLLITAGCVESHGHRDIIEADGTDAQEELCALTDSRPGFPESPAR